jgi:hypothetical protein
MLVLLSIVLSVRRSTTLIKKPVPCGQLLEYKCIIGGGKSYLDPSNERPREGTLGKDGPD